MQRMFDSDDSCQDPDYHPQADLIELKDLVGQPSASTVSNNDCLNIFRDCNQSVQAEDDLEVRAIAISILDLVLQKVFDRTKSLKRWKKSDPNNWKINMAKKGDQMVYHTSLKVGKKKVRRSQKMLTAANAFSNATYLK